MASQLYNDKKELAPRAFINGISVVIEPNDTILEAARRAGIFIPTLCEFAALNHRPGTCRICLVDIDRADGGHDIVTSCDTKIEPGMRIHTRTAEVRRRQRLQMELLFADHDENCSSCSRHGDCELQKAALWVGLEGSHISGNIWQTVGRMLPPLPCALTAENASGACAASRSAAACRGRTYRRSL